MHESDLYSHILEIVKKIQILLAVLQIKFVHTQSSKQFNSKCSKDEEQEEEEQTKISDLRKSLHNGVKKSSDTLGHFEELQNSGNPQDSHHSDYSWIDREDLTLDFFQSDANY